MKKLKISFVVLSLVVSSASFGGKIYKCKDADGSVTFSSSVCPDTTAVREEQKIRPHHETKNASEKYSIENQRRHFTGQSSKSSGDTEKYSLENQLEYFNSGAQRHRTARGNRAKSVADCEYYRARVNEYRHKLGQNYSTQAKRLSDTSYLKLLEGNVADYCY